MRITPNFIIMIRLSVDLEALYRLYAAGGIEAYKPLLKQALALESAGADGIVFKVGGPYDPGRRRVISVLSESLDISLSVRTSLDEQWIQAILETKPSLAIFTLDGTSEDSYREVVTRLQVQNILVAFEVRPQAEAIKTAAKLKGDFLVFGCDSYLEAKGLGDQIEQLNSISRAAALGSRLSMGSIASGDFDRQKLARLVQTKSVEEVFIGLPVFTDSLIRGYQEAIKSIKSLL